MGDYDALGPTERGRLERFAAAFEAVDPFDYEMFAGATASEADLETARAAALGALGSSTRRAAVEHAAEAFSRAAERAQAERSLNPLLAYGGAMHSPRVDDRVAFARSLDWAVVAVILWDELDEVERDVLLGPWAHLAARALSEAR